MTEIWQTAINIMLIVTVMSIQTMQMVPAHAAENAPLKNIPVGMGFAGTSTDQGLTPAAKEAAILLNILPKVERLIQIKQSRQGNDAGLLNDEELALKVSVLDKVMGAALQVRMVSGKIDREIAWSFAGQGSLQAKRQRILNFLFTANFMQGGILGILSGPAFLDGQNKTGTELLLVASSVGLGLSTLALIESRSGHKTIDGETNILANVFHLSRTNPEYDSNMVLKFLDSVPPEAKDKKTRIESLEEGWRKGHYLRTTNEMHLEKLAEVQPKEGKYKEDIRLLSDRVRLLFDTQWTVQQLDAELLELLRVTDLN